MSRAGHAQPADGFSDPYSLIHPTLPSGCECRSNLEAPVNDVGYVFARRRIHEDAIVDVAAGWQRAW